MKRGRIFLFFFVYLLSSGFKVYRTESTGLAVKWFGESIPVRYYINEKGSDGIPLEDLVQSVNDSFKAWEVEGSFIKSEYAGRTDAMPEKETQTDKEIKNVVGWVENWNDEPEAIGITTVSYNSDTGEIIEADMALNGRNFQWTLNPPYPCPSKSTVDLKNVVTHEAGHFFGLDHSDISSATMYPTSPPCETEKRDLEQDDINGITYLYPKNGIPIIKEIYPLSGTNSEEDFELNIYGMNFSSSVSVHLIKGSSGIKAKSTKRITSSQVKAFFNLKRAEEGKYSVLVINNPSDNPYMDILANSFDVVPGSTTSYDGGRGCSSSGFNPFLFLLPAYFIFRYVSRP